MLNISDNYKIIEEMEKELWNIIMEEYIKDFG